MNDFNEISYSIDAKDRLATISPEWAGFALKNDGQGLTPESVVGRPLWDFIADEPTRKLYRAVLTHVRSGSATELILRCDAPERRRLIEMQVKREPDGSVKFTTVLLGSKVRAVQRLLDKSTPRTTRKVMVCSWCDKVKVDVEKWSEVEAAMEYLHLTREPELPMIEPVVCPECYARVMEIISTKPLEGFQPSA